MNYLRFFWYFGYKVVDISKDKTYCLEIGRFTLFDKDGNTTEIDLDNGCGFLIELGEHQLKCKRVPDFTANAPFFIRVGKKSKWDDTNKIKLFIPSSLLNTTFGEEFEMDACDSSVILTYRKVFFEAKHFRTYSGQPHPNITVEDLGDGWNQRLGFNCFVKSETKDWYNRNTKLSQQIKETCGISLNPYELRDLLKHYKLTKIRKPKETKTN